MLLCGWSKSRIIIKLASSRIFLGNCCCLRCHLINERIAFHCLKSLHDLRSWWCFIKVCQVKCTVSHGNQIQSLRIFDTYRIVAVNEHTIARIIRNYFFFSIFALCYNLYNISKTAVIKRTACVDGIMGNKREIIRILSDKFFIPLVKNPTVSVLCFIHLGNIINRDNIIYKLSSRGFFNLCYGYIIFAWGESCSLPFSVFIGIFNANLRSFIICPTLIIRIFISILACYS